MFPYFIMVGIPAYLSILFQYSEIKQCKIAGYELDLMKRRNYRIVIDVFFIIWLLLLAFRSETVGSDLVIYKYHFNRYANMSWDYIMSNNILSQHDPAYVLLCKIVSNHTNNFQWVVVISALISVLPIWKLYRNDGQNGFLTIVLFLNIAPFVMYFSGLRQAMAMAFSVPCYYYCRDKKLLKFLLMIVFAYHFHKSSLVLLLMYPTYHIHWRKKIHLFYLLPIIAFVYVLKIQIFSFLLLFMNDMYIERYGDGIKLTGAISVLLLLIVLLLYSFLIVDQEKLDRDTLGLRNLLVLSVLLQIFSGAHTIAMRMNYYYLLFIPLLIDRIIKIGNEREEKILKLSKICMLAFFTFYYFYSAYTDANKLNVYPYNFFWENVL